MAQPATVPFAKSSAHSQGVLLITCRYRDIFPDTYRLHRRNWHAAF